MEKKKIKYGNWVPEKLLIILFVIGIIFLGGTIVFALFSLIAGAIICAILSLFF